MYYEITVSRVISRGNLRSEVLKSANIEIKNFWAVTPSGLYIDA
jgi:hypothetical protein